MGDLHYLPVDPQPDGERPGLTSGDFDPSTTARERAVDLLHEQTSLLLDVCETVVDTLLARTDVLTWLATGQRIPAHPLAPAWGAGLIPDTFGLGVRDPICPREHLIDTTTDRRMLWHLAHELSAGTTERQREFGRAAETYLHATCVHHWHEWRGDEEIEAHRQCLWCNDVQWRSDDPVDPWSDATPERVR